MRITEPTSARRAIIAASVVAALLGLGVSLAGCGSSSESTQTVGLAYEQSITGFRAATDQFITDLQSGHEKRACEVIAAGAAAELNRAGGCPAALSRLYLRLDKELRHFYRKVLPQVQVEGDAASANGTVYARFENGRWHLENSIW